MRTTSFDKPFIFEPCMIIFQLLWKARKEIRTYFGFALYMHLTTYWLTERLQQSACQYFRWCISVQACGRIFSFLNSWQSYTLKSFFMVAVLILLVKRGKNGRSGSEKASIFSVNSLMITLKSACDKLCTIWIGLLWKSKNFCVYSKMLFSLKGKQRFVFQKYFLVHSFCLLAAF